MGDFAIYMEMNPKALSFKDEVQVAYMYSSLKKETGEEAEIFIFTFCQALSSGIRREPVIMSGACQTKALGKK